jgi:alkylation response protein AidB-like acyl-CoA dehydrogenase
VSHYKSNLRDIEFNLFEVFGAQGYLGTDGPFAAMDADTAQMVLREVDRFARESVWAESFVDTDRTPLELSEDGDITVPESLDQALQAYYEAGWHTLPLPTHLGGFGAPPSIRWAATELFAGGHATASLWPIGAFMSMIIDRIGTEGQKSRFARPMVEERWGSTMVLTEPDAGSDVGAGVTKATKVEENGSDDLGSIYHIEGIKRFITSADYQGHENTVHLVLARPQPDPPAQPTPGTKGLSLFIVPKFLVNEDGSLGERNGVRVSNIEKKMGIKGSATCELTMGDKQPCIGYLAGDVHDGIAQMFQVIEYARMMVGTKAMATLSTGYLNALEYAKIRVQGPDMTQMTDKTAPKVEIISHPDVRRLLMEQKAHAEGMRALVMFTGWIQDQADLARDAGTSASSTDDEQEHAAWLAREDLLLPMVKGYCSEKAYELLAQSLQVFGGSGFTQDYPIEQYIRDAKIDTLYEGTTAIQSLDLLFRKIARDQGQTLLWLAEQIKEMTKSTGDDDRFATERQLLGDALEDTQSHLGALVGYLMASMEDPSARAEIYKTGLQSVALLNSLSELTIGWLLLRQAEVAAAKLDEATGTDADFYAGKIAAVRYYARNVLPKAKLRRELAETEDNALMELDAAAF